MAEKQGHPILAGLIALLAVGLAVGLVMGGAALAGTRVLGLGGGDDVETPSETAVTASMYLPKPEPTEEPSGPQITLAPGASKRPSAQATEKEEPEESLTLNAGQSEVAPMGRIDLNGKYRGGDGRTLQVQRFVPGSGWTDFGVSATVSNQTFSTWIQTGRTGETRFRMLDRDGNVESNEVRVRIG